VRALQHLHGIARARGPVTRAAVHPTMTEPELVGALRARYGPPEHAFLEQARSRTGYGGPICTIDALAMSLFPSRGFELSAFEIKAGKSGRKDWLREKKKPTKADEIYQHVDRFWLVVGDLEIVKAGELPPTWGLLVPAKRGGLSIKVNATKLKPRPLARPFLAAIFRNLERAKRDMITRDEIADALDQARELGRREGAREAPAARHELEELRATVAAFKEASGLGLERWTAGDIGQAVRIVQTIGVEKALDRADHLAQSLARGLADLTQRTTDARGLLGAAPEGRR
jgi:hypothetical protein